jgi:YggT family protein
LESGPDEHGAQWGKMCVWHWVQCCERVTEENILSNLATAILIVTRILMLVVLADVLASYFLDPYNNIRRFLDNLVQPLLAPIRRMLPSAGMLDLSPLVLLILLELIGRAVMEILL